MKTMSGNAIFAGALACILAIGASAVGNATEIMFQKVDCALTKAQVCVLDNNKADGR
jgi:hypothetical protein